jgi:hypothetical protein
MKIYIVGNELVENDRLPLEILPELEKTFPQYSFERVDPNEDFIPEEGSIIVDSVEGIQDVTWFESLDSFIQTRSVSPHDYDLGFHLLLLKKLHKITSVKILGVPQQGEHHETLQRVVTALQEYSSTV